MIERGDVAIELIKDEARKNEAVYLSDIREAVGGDTLDVVELIDELIAEERVELKAIG